MSEKPKVDINCDMGESFGRWKLGDDEGMFPFISSANIACGYHAADPETILKTVAGAVTAGVAPGAHPGLPDLLGFGRRRMDISPHAAYAYVMLQAAVINGALRPHGKEITHIKLHAEMNFVANRSAQHAAKVTQAAVDALPNPTVYWLAPPGVDPFLPELHRCGVRVLREFYPDLFYGPGGVLEPPKTLAFQTPKQAAEQTRRALCEGVVLTSDGTTVPLKFETICVHADNPNGVQLAEAVRKAVEAEGWQVSADANPCAPAVRAA